MNLSVFIFILLKSKKALGAIPLAGLSVLELDDRRKDSIDAAKPARVKVNRILLTTSVGARHVLEAVTPEERDSWVTHLKLVAASLQAQIPR